MKLSLKVNFSILIIFIIIALIFIFTMIPFQNARINNSLKIIITMLNILSESERVDLANEIFEKRKNAIKLRLKIIKDIDYITSISVFNNENHLIWEEGNKIKVDNSNFEYFKNKDLKKIIFSKRIKYNNSDLLMYIRPIFVIGEHIGYIVIHYNLDNLKKEKKIAYIIYSCLLIIIFFNLIVLLHSIINWTILRPINYLNKAMIKVQNSGPGIKAEINSNDEIGELSKTFNQMSIALAKSYKKIKKQGEKLKSSLIEKDVLFRELHHRVKNNLSLILSLLELQEKNFNDKNVIANYKKVQTRIYSIALIHKLLYKSKNISNINIKEYINDLVVNLRNSYNISKINFIIKVEGCKLDIDTIKTVGIILNELIINSIKYAFQEKDDCNITINFFKDDKNYSLIVKDNGIGYKNYNIENNELSGLNLVKMLCEEIKAEMQIINKNGLKIKINFPIKLKRDLV